MIFNSIRWRLQLWYGLILIGVLVGFGVTAYQLERTRQFRTIDEDLQRKLQTLSKALELNGPRGDFRRPPPPEDGPLHSPPDGFEWPDEIKALEPAGLYYYLIIRRDGGLMAMSTNLPLAKIYPSTNNVDAPFSLYRQVVLTTPPGEKLIIGRSIVSDLVELHAFGWTLAGAGIVVLFCGILGGWWLAARAIRPIEEISGTAVKIAAGDLSQRINISDMENELGRLAGVLNSTFARLESAFAQQSQFTADAAHELRTPVSVILSQTQTILKRDRDAADYRETLEACQRAAQKMRRLLESLLELARLDAGQEPMKRFQFDLSETVRDCLELVQPLAKERGIKTESNLPKLEIAGDPDRLAQVITNLVTNAIHYNKEQGAVTVSVQSQNKTTLVTVADTGQGISAEELLNLFKRFYRADKSRSGIAGQTGLGLAISKAIVEAHGGTIEVSSKLGIGTTFVVRLPLNEIKS